MRINNIDVSQFGGVLYDVGYTPAGTTLSAIWTHKIGTPKISGKDRGLGTLSLSLLILGDTEQECHTNASRFYRECVKLDECELFIKRMNRYFVGFASMPKESYFGYDDSKGSHVLDVSITFKVGYAMSEIKTEVLNSKTSGAIINRGVYDTPCRIELKALAVIPSLTIEGLGGKITVETMSLNDLIVIDGDTGELTKNGTAYINKIDLVSIPYLTPGDVTVSLNSDKVEMSIIYREMY